ncbi:hypothetical protein F2Q69_00033784 [Brassica cretica]|uniref:glutamine--tRNA ligase n=1 Tax=Brassica cretica TaxID=69181 RepID=A0A8S9SP18_BRACR|nr:hypothetical protein F2Q69_00033784 [Brassica cretica]
MSWIGGFPEACEAPAALFVFFLREGTPELPSPTFLPPLGEVSSFPHFGFKFLQCFLLFSSGHAILLISTRGHRSLQRDDIVQRVRPRVIFLLFPSLGFCVSAISVKALTGGGTLIPQALSSDDSDPFLCVRGNDRKSSGSQVFRTLGAVQMIEELTSTGCKLTKFRILLNVRLFRYDDTNPEAEKKEYINHIEEIVNWMGWAPFKITYTSDYFQELYDLAVELIRRGHAYVDHQFTPHPHAGDKWCIYPTYDFAHCIVDSLENITHSLCTLEFETRRASYYWLLHSLDLYMPYVWEYSRLNITNTVMSKRKLNYIVTNKHVDGWDDPRLLTLAGLRRRADGTMIHMSRLEHHIREALNKTAPRAMVVLNPLRVVITNLESDKVVELDAKRWPDAQNDDLSAFYKVPFSRVVYIDQSDFRMKDSKGYYGLAPGKSVLLRYGFPIKCTNVVFADDNETIREIHAEYDHEKKTKPKGVLHWVAESSPGKEPIKIEVRLFEKLFNSENPAKLNDKWLTDINPNSKVVVSDAYGGSILKDAVVGDRFQFERLGYFAVNKDSEPGKLVFNRTVTFRDSYGKGGK